MQEARHGCIQDNEHILENLHTTVVLQHKYQMPQIACD